MIDIVYKVRFGCLGTQYTGKVLHVHLWRSGHIQGISCCELNG